MITVPIPDSLRYSGENTVPCGVLLLCHYYQSGESAQVAFGHFHWQAAGVEPNR